MPDDLPLEDDQVHDRLVAAADALGRAPGRTRRGDTAINAARRAMRLLQFALVKAMEDEADQVEGVEPSIRD